ncbi:FG-GAP repeat domain-containing protein [Chitinophaga nivalis]|uniref:VCBS repeat-containing protein n=1 Tax=Chitinophaga nivalis TaxID=2991709 RepID=A0ABT3IJP4_9BACT|nr:VCBS repeat-containing protein [Chitinophaga nivalis]MCW3466127.1 VCBS repeat-containing protein [Chitinophaga nivalis]MCW3484182.1 VCBS repeat-containing protein [Chitinophaga nivalis]
MKKTIILYCVCCIAALYLTACKKEAQLTTASADKTADKPAPARKPKAKVINTLNAFGWIIEGGDVAATDLNGNGIPDLIYLINDAPAGPNYFRYYVGWDVSETGYPSSVTGIKQIASNSSISEGAGIAVGDIDKNGIPDLVLLAYDAPDGPNNFVYIVGFNLNANGDPAYWSSPITVFGTNYVAQGAAASLADIDANGTLDLLLSSYHFDVEGKFTYKIAFNLNSAGFSTNIKDYGVHAGTYLGHIIQDIGTALADLNGDGKQELFIVGNDNPPGQNSFRVITATVTPTGELEKVSGFKQYEGLGESGQGTGVTIADFDRDGTRDILFLSVTDTPAEDYYKYYIGYSITWNPRSKTWEPFFD